jgi:hypothetical protein
VGGQRGSFEKAAGLVVGGDQTLKVASQARVRTTDAIDERLRCDAGTSSAWVSSVARSGLG